MRDIDPPWLGSCEVCGAPAMHEYRWGGLVLHAYCELHDQAATAYRLAAIRAVLDRELEDEEADGERWP